MTDADEPTTTTTEQPSQPQLPGFLVFVTVAAWLVATIMAIVAWSDFNERRDSFSISAPQVLQIADEMFAAVLPWVVGAMGVTAIAVVIGMTSLMQAMHRRA